MTNDNKKQCKKYNRNKFDECRKKLEGKVEKCLK